MTRQVRFSQQAHTCDASSLRKLVPIRFAERVEIQLFDYARKQSLYAAEVLQRGRIAAVRLNDPFKAAHVSQKLTQTRALVLAAKPPRAGETCAQGNRAHEL